MLRATVTWSFQYRIWHMKLHGCSNVSNFFATKKYCYSIVLPFIWTVLNVFRQLIWMPTDLVSHQQKWSWMQEKSTHTSNILFPIKVCWLWIDPRSTDSTNDGMTTAMFYLCVHSGKHKYTLWFWMCCPKIHIQQECLEPEAQWQCRAIHSCYTLKTCFMKVGVAACAHSCFKKQTYPKP